MEAAAGLRVTLDLGVAYKVCALKFTEPYTEVCALFYILMEH